MRSYECVFILKAALDDSEVENQINGLKEIVTSRGGEIQKKDIWGKRRLAYDIDGNAEGIYVLVYFRGNNEILDELRRVFRYNDQVIRHMIVQNENPNIVEPDVSETETAGGI
ncbi:MAG: 30S ribosomal protein S6 [Candidatus Krumholzibacteriales bacterium]